MPKSDSPLRYKINPSDHIISVNDAWLAFAHNNDGDMLTREGVINHLLWDFIVDEETANLYSIMLEKVRAGETIRFKFRCDSAQSRRFMKMEISLLADKSVQFESRIIREESREAVKLLDVKVVRTQEFLTICGWCKKLKNLEGSWVEIEEAIADRELFHKKEIPKLTHGICSVCYENVLSTMD
jgi:hypothetical protein